MGAETKPGARATFPDGSSETWTTAPGVELSGEALAAFVRVCIKPEPTQVEIVQLPVEDIDIRSSTSDIV